MRNLRNILEAEVSLNHFNHVCETIFSKDKVLKSKQLSFRFLAAYREFSQINSSYASKIMNALEEAVKISSGNIKGFDESTKVLVACDFSGSMHQLISPKSKVLHYDIGLMLGMLLKSRCKKIISGIFGDKCKIIILPKYSIFCLL